MNSGWGVAIITLDLKAVPFLKKKLQYIHAVSAVPSTLSRTLISGVIEALLHKAHFPGYLLIPGEADRRCGVLHLFLEQKILDKWVSLAFVVIDLIYAIFSLH